MTEWRRLLFYQIELLLHFFNTQLKRCSLGPMINAVSLVPCGHSLCKSCHTQNKDQNSQTGDRCYCKQQTTAAIANYSVRDGVGKLPAICAFCNLEGSMETLAVHVTECEQKPVECKDCWKKMSFEKLKEHLCPKTVLTCECGYNIQRSLMEGHKFSICPLLETPCPLGCEERLKR